IFVEEIRIHGQSRFEMVDKLKPFLTNDVIEVHRKGKDAYSIPNVTNYVMFTNHFDALPLNENDRRFFVVSTSFQTKADIDEFNRVNPSHFSTIFDALGEYPHVLRGWLMSRKLSAEFEPKRAAPMTSAKENMKEMARTDEMDAINDILEGKHAPDLTEYMLNVSKLVEQAPLLVQTTMPHPKILRAMLEQSGFVCIGRIRAGENGERVRVYTKHPKLFEAKDKLEVCRAILSGEPPELML